MRAVRTPLRSIFLCALVFATYVVTSTAQSGRAGGANSAGAALIARAADKIRIAEGKRFDVITGDLFTVAGDEPLRGKHWEVVLAFNIFHHFLKHKALHDKLVAWLQTLNVDVMIFEPHRTGEPQMKAAYANYDEQQAVDFILSNSMLRHSELVTRCTDGRPVYKLWR